MRPSRTLAVLIVVLASLGMFTVAMANDGEVGGNIPRQAIISSSSFPSGHTVEAMAVAIALVYVFAKAGKPARHWFYVAVGYGLLMALSRTFLRVHWLSDVAVGTVIGATTAMAAVWIVERFTLGISGALESVFGWVARRER